MRYSLGMANWGPIDLDELKRALREGADRSTRELREQSRADMRELGEQVRADLRDRAELRVEALRKEALVDLKERNLEDLCRLRDETLRELREEASRQRPIGETLLAGARGFFEDVLPAIAEAFVRWGEGLEENLPPNWSSLTFPQVFAAAKLMEGTGWSLVETPPGDAMLAILTAPSAPARRERLLEHEPRVLDDLDRLLSSIGRTELLDVAHSARECLEAHRSGLFRPAQALCAATLSTTIHERFQMRSHTTAAKRFRGRDPAFPGAREFRSVAILRAVAKALEDYEPLTGRPERSDFNRHASAHRVKTPQYSQVNSLSGLMLLVSLLVELNEVPAIESLWSDSRSAVREPQVLERAS